MAIWIQEDAKVIVQGITGRQGSFHATKMLEYGTSIVGGCTPGRAVQRSNSADIPSMSGTRWRRRSRRPWLMPA